MTTATRPLLIPTSDPTPVENAAVDGILDNFEPETFLWITFHRPNGGARVWYAWTEGGQPLGNQTDHHALTTAMDAADWLAIADRHGQHHTRGRIAIQAYLLRPVLADVRTGRGDTGDIRGRLRKLCQETGLPAPGQLRLPWLGFGPAVLARSSR